MQYGAFAQAEYTQDKLSVSVSGNINAATNWRKGYFYVDNETSEKVTKLGFGAKAGANYNITSHHNVFGNIGYFSRTPYFSGGIFLNTLTSNALNPNSTNEKVFSFELGYGYVSSVLNVNLNLYRTSWNDRSIQKRLGEAQESSYVYLNGVNELHQGVELEFTYRPIRPLTINGMFSLGDWTLSKNGIEGYMYNGNGQAVNDKMAVVETGSPEHAKVIMNMDGINVGNSAQTTAALGVNYEVLKGLYLGVNGNFYGRNYADYDVSGLVDKNKLNKEIDVAQPWRIPSAFTFDANINYRFKLGNLDASWTANCNNLLNEQYITDALDNGTKKGGHGWQDATVFYGFGRTWSMSMKIRF